LIKNYEQRLGEESEKEKLAKKGNREKKRERRD